MILLKPVSKFIKFDEELDLFLTFKEDAHDELCCAFGTITDEDGRMELENKPVSGEFLDEHLIPFALEVIDQKKLLKDILYYRYSRKEIALRLLDTVSVGSEPLHLHAVVRVTPDLLASSFNVGVISKVDKKFKFRLEDVYGLCDNMYIPISGIQKFIKSFDRNGYISDCYK